MKDLQEQEATVNNNFICNVESLQITAYRQRLAFRKSQTVEGQQLGPVNLKFLQGYNLCFQIEETQDPEVDTANRKTSFESFSPKRV